MSTIQAFMSLRSPLIVAIGSRQKRVLCSFGNANDPTSDLSVGAIIAAVADIIIGNNSFSGRSPPSGRVKLEWMSSLTTFDRGNNVRTETRRVEDI
jgi:hypothetical protein